MLYPILSRVVCSFSCAGLRQTEQGHVTSKDCDHKQTIPAVLRMFCMCTSGFLMHIDSFCEMLPHQLQVSWLKMGPKMCYVMRKGRRAKNSTVEEN